MNVGVYQAQEQDEFPTPEGCFILELSNTPQDSHLSIARARVPAGGSTVPHRLHGVDERYVILQGSGRVMVGELLSEVHAGDLVQIPRGTAQSITNTADSDLVFLCVCTPPFTPTCYEPIAEE